MSIENYLTPHFKISEQEIAEWKASAAQANESLIFWILKNKKINSDKYSEWSFKKYKLPRLKISFFQNHKVNKTFLEKYSHLFPEHVLPIKEWKDVLYLTCLEPVYGLDIPQEYQWILVPIEGILLWKNSYSAKDTTSSISISQIPYPALTKTKESKESHKTQMNQTELEDINFSQINVSSKKVSQETNTVIEKTKNTQITPQMKKNSVSSSLLKTSNKVSSSSTKEPYSSSVKTNESQKKSSAMPKSPVTTKKISPALQITPPSFLQKKSPVTTEDSSSKINPHNGKKFESQEHTEICRYVLNCMDSLFDKSMILILKDRILKPWKWDTSWPKQPSTHNVILLNKPSVFRIVYKTKQKYHGYVVPNPVNDTFFQVWNKGKYPEHLSLLPLMTKEKVIKGMLLGITSKSKGKMILLDKLDILAIDAFEKVNTFIA